MPIRALGFDVDGTLYPASEVYRRLFLQGLPRIKTLLAFSRIRKHFRELNLDPAYRALGIQGVEAFHRYQAGLLATELGIGVSEAHEEIEHFFYGLSTDVFSAISPYPGVVETLKGLRSAGFRLGALSDFPCDKKLDLMGLSEFFDVSMTSEETGFVKPDRASFDALSDRLGVRSSEILYIGNSERYDVEGSLASGMRAALISRRSRPRTKAEFSFFDWKSLEAYVSASRDLPDTR